METRIRFFNRENIFAFAFFVILLTLIWLTLSILDPFLGDFFWAMILAFTFYPVYRRLYGRLKGKGNLAAFLLTAMVLVLLVLPGFFILMNLGKEARKAYQALSSPTLVQKSRSLKDRLSASGAQQIMEKFGIEPDQAEAILRNGVDSGLKAIPRIVGEKVSQVFKNLALFVLHVFFVAVALFFLFRDGARYAGLLVELLPLEQAHRETVVATFSKTVSAVVRGMFITALAQGLLAGTGFAVAGLHVPVLLGVLTAITSMIPFLGATSVWLPAAIWLFMQDQYLAAVGLGLYGALVISTVDNILKPLIIGEGTKMPVFLLFFTILGGLKVYGVLGIFLGPIILSMGMAFLSIYKEVYLKPAREKEPSQGNQRDRRQNGRHAGPEKGDIP
ncbi:MAG: AI-2E family transporter [Deltaproteobacteria bacterium]|nr:AI-2E family transporter [Deltaproteobacteria bacterium]